MFKILTVVGARPQFIKCASVSRQLRDVATEILVHTGQHYDACMSEVFFRDLNIPQPKYNLGIGSGTHGYQTGEMLKRIEELLAVETPDLVLVYGDTNSTLAGALAAAKLHIPIAHVEAGLRSFNRQMPEEINRVVTDHVSSILLCPTQTAINNLTKEGITEGVQKVGDVMYDALCHNLCIAQEDDSVLRRLTVRPKEYFLATVHRAENTDDPVTLDKILRALMKLASGGAQIVFPVHPRTKNLFALAAHSRSCPGLILTEPVSYLDMLVLENNAKAILTDSGGVQKEAFWLSVPCVTLREETEWVETVESGWNFVVGSNEADIVDCVRRIDGKFSHRSPATDDGHASERVVMSLLEAYEVSNNVLAGTP